MPRQKVMITNADRQGKVYAPPRWFVRVGKASRTFDQAAWESGGQKWLHEQLRGGNA